MKQKELNGYIVYGCDECGKEFDSVMGLKVHNGKKHGGESVTVKCSNCGVEKETPTYEARTYNHHFCNKDCKRQFQNNTNKLGNFKGGDQATIHTCSWCGDNFFGTTQSVGNVRWCSRDCQISALAERAKYRTGSDHWAWQGGVSAYHGVRRNLGERNWAYIAEEFRQKKGNRCEWCGGESELDRRLDVHHIVPIRTGGTHHNDNLMVLCRSCHSKAEAHARKLFGNVLIDESHTQPLNGYAFDSSQE